MRKMKNINTKNADAKIFVPPMIRGRYATDKTEKKHISMFWLNKKAFDKENAEIISVVVILDRPIVVEWGVHTGKIVTGLADLIRAHARDDVVKIIDDFATVYEIERDCMEMEKENREQPAYDPEGKKAQIIEAVKVKKKTPKRGEDGEPYDVQVPGYFRKNGKYVCGYEKRMPLRGRRVSKNTVDPVAEAKKTEKLPKLPKTRVSGKKGKYAAVEELVCVDLRQGLKYREISEKHNVPIPEISYMAKRNGLSRYKKAQAQK